VSSVDYRNTKITQHALKMSRVFEMLKLDTVEKKKNTKDLTLTPFHVLTSSVLNLFTAPACQISGLEGAHKNSIVDGPITNLLSKLCILIEILSCALANGGKTA